ncbi:hypothetical protein OK351_17030 [Glutamicibacter sp. MNS18]|uniref:hypothetical protein n=1 Tax=Glutamicibacter sp. MNS18 TaxID=2989817 RepID=UPI002235C56A|nr:hypothetical protein [Glutamicibacter sp. MNS18]MCW4467186.1 hypothetical protein [Glutamicibacter sp. MNS18]
MTVSPVVFAKSPAPTIKGTTQVGNKLTAPTGNWSPKAKFTSQWYRGNTKIKGATKSTYTPVEADLNKSLKVRIVGSASGYKNVTRDSKARKIAVGKIVPR